MTKNQVRFQKGLSLPELMDTYGTEEQCEQVLLSLKWLQGYSCREYHGAK